MDFKEYQHITNLLSRINEEIKGVHKTLREIHEGRPRDTIRATYGGPVNLTPEQWKLISEGRSAEVFKVVREPETSEWP